MKRYDIDGGIPTLAVALSEHMNADELKKLASLTSGPVPTRKAELADLIVRHLEGTRLRVAWQSLDELQKAAVAEVVHSHGTQFPADRSQAKYGRAPSWGSLDPYRRDERPTALRFFLYGGAGGGGVMPDDLKVQLGHVPVGFHVPVRIAAVGVDEEVRVQGDATSDLPGQGCVAGARTSWSVSLGYPEPFSSDILSHREASDEDTRGHR